MSIRGFFINAYSTQRTKRESKSDLPVYWRFIGKNGQSEKIFFWFSTRNSENERKGKEKTNQWGGRIKSYGIRYYRFEK